MSIDTPMTQFFSTHALVRSNVLNTEPAMGIELEYEECNGPMPEMTFWRAENDGSLRNSGIEYISVPLQYTEVEDALLEIEQVVEQTNATSSERCGLHTHMNMRPYTVGQVWSFIAAYALVEPTIFATFAEGREDSVFGVPLWMNQPQVSALYVDICGLRSLTDDRSMEECNTAHTCKYSALNLGSLRNLGTVEMRQPYCTNDFAAIRSWTDFCIRLHEFGTSFDDPDEILELYEREGLAALQEGLFGAAYNINDERQELAEDAAYYIAGYTEPSWQELDWTLEEIA